MEIGGKTIFIAGAYGTGKSTLCAKLAAELQIPFYSAGDLISKINGERYGVNKVVADKNKNQDLLTEEIQKLNQLYKRIILAGHFCIFNSSNNVEILPESVFFNLNIEQIILLEAKKTVIANNLKQRDNKEYSLESIYKLMIQERKQSEKIAKHLGCKLSIYQMTFSDEDRKNAIILITKEDKPL